MNKTEEELIWESYTTNMNIKNDFVKYAAENLFATAWADYVDLLDSKQPGLGRLSGKDVYNEKPDIIPKEAVDEAIDLLISIEKINKQTINQLFSKAIEVGGENNIQRFAFSLTMSSLGHGVSWFDDNPKFDLKLPLIEFSFYNFNWPTPDEEDEEDEDDQDEDDQDGEGWKK